MRLFSKLISLFMVIGVVSSFVLSANAKDYAADYTDWPTTFSQFNVISRANSSEYWNAYTCAAQRFLGTYNSDFEDVLDSNGNPSGYFDDTTHEIVKDYQGLKGNMSVDGIIGSGTWCKFASDLNPVRNGIHTYFKSINSGEYVIKAEESNYQFTFYYYYYQGPGMYSLGKFRSP